jgi:hypothetical protein
MAVALDMGASLTLFQNALVYTIAADSVTSIIDTADASSTLLLILTIALVVSFTHSISSMLPVPAVAPAIKGAAWQCGVCRKPSVQPKCRTCPFSMHLQLRLGPFVEMVHFLVATITNILLQFESTLVARLVIATISPSKVGVEWVGLYVTTATCMLWLIKRAFA